MKTKNYINKMNVFELIGIIIGDGSIWYYPDKKAYALEISGNAEEEQEYFIEISKFLEQITGKKAKIKVKTESNAKTLKLYLYSKEFVEYLINDLKITNKNKTFTAKIDEKFLDWEFSKHVLRGLFDTDGSLYFSKIKGIYNYPRLEIKTSSKELAEQIIEILSKNGFNPKKRTSKSDRTIGICLNGPEMLDKWFKDIGFRNEKNLSKYLVFKKLGHSIPKISTKERIELMGGWPSG